MLTRLLASPVRRAVIVVAAAVVTLLVTWAVIDLVRIQRDISNGQEVLRAAKASDLARPRGIARLADIALARFKRADRLANSSVPLKLVRPIPLFGRQVSVLRSMTNTATEVGVIGDEAARVVQAQLDRATQGPAARVVLLDVTLHEVSRARGRLKQLKVNDDAWVLPPLSGARAHLADGLASARARLGDVSVMAGALRRMLAGPSRYLILAGNNAEMRAGGMPLSAGVAEIRDGALSIDGFTSSSDLFLRDGVPVPPSLKDLYGWMSIGAEWRATTATPNFPASGQMYAQMAPRAGLGEVDGVILVDVRALRAVVAATGPVELDGTRYTSRNIEQQVMNENYIRFGDPTAQQGRYDLQGRLGVAIFEALNSRPLKLGPLVSNLSAAGKGRHLLAWSADPDLRTLWQRARIDGALDPNGLMVNMQNISANKLDWYVTPRIGLRTLWVRRGIRRVELSVTFSNKKRTRTSDVVEGIVYNRTHGMKDGEHRVFLVAYLPKTASDVASADPPFSSSGIDGSMKAAGFTYGVEVGKSRTVTITFSVPKGQHFKVIPSARAHPVTITTPKARYTDAEPVTIVL